MATKTTTADSARASADPGTLTLVCLLAWAVPGAAHVWLGRRQKGAVFFVVLGLMFSIGLALHGRIFPFEFSEPLVALAAIADIGVGVPWMLARMAGTGAGLVTATTYEYGNTFLIVAGLLNFLVILDAFDVAMGRK
jgi:hypothetical protein